MASGNSPTPHPGGGRGTSRMGKNIVKVREEDGSDRLLLAGQPDYTRCDNTLITSKYTILNFLPITVRDQFRRFANMYFLIVGGIMFVGTYYPNLYQSAFSPWTTWGPIALFISISLLNEGLADKKRHVSDRKTNTFRCIVLENTTADTTPVADSMTSSMNNSMVNVSAKNRREAAEADEIAQKEIPWDDVDIPVPNGSKTKAFFRPIERKDIRQGHLVLIRNREMIPADIVLLASSGDRGCAYIETSSIDGETNLKLRLSAKHKTDPSFNQPNESIEEAARRIAGFTAIGCPNYSSDARNRRIAELSTEPPDAHINTFTGLLKLSPLATIDEEDPVLVSGNGPVNVPLSADNLLLRGAVLRNTEWAIGIACFTGTDTKLSQNAVEAPSKFAQLDIIINKCVLVMVFVELLCIVGLSTSAVLSNKKNIEELWYVGRIPEGTPSIPWPYLQELPHPVWQNKGQNWIQYSLTNITLLSYFVPLSMYFTLEVCNFFLMWLMYIDIDMYDATTDTRAEPRSTIYPDLGQIQYIFSDKTGTLTQNVMRFKRCSVDGMVFGNPVIKAEPKAENVDEKNQSSFLPLRQVLAGHVTVAEGGRRLEAKKGMTFNAELFLRVMSLCHTVVVEKDLDLPKGKNGKKASNDTKNAAAADGAPVGYAFQAESPDEGALVSASSNIFGMQVVSRDSTGIRLKCNHPSLFRDEELIRQLKSGKVDPGTVASQSASGSRVFKNFVNDNSSKDIETWSVLAINKFDSTRKRMSILLRSPPEFGGCAILFCKGADSAMLDPDVSASSQTLTREKNEQEGAYTSKDNPEGDSEWEMAQTLGIESHLGEFASEGLRTLVLGVRFLTDEQCSDWLVKYAAAASAIKGREEKLTEVAFEIERELHIVGATAIEDKLQDGVPDTIATLAKAGINLWVLTGDKRETAIEIGYSTKVLTQKMHLTQMSDQGEQFVRAQCAMEFMRLVKAGKLPSYQRAALTQQGKSKSSIACLFVPCFALVSCVGIILSSVKNLLTSFRRMMLQLNIACRKILGMKKRAQEESLKQMDELIKASKEKKSDLQRRCGVRDRAEAIIREYSKTNTSNDSNEPLLSSDDLPEVFNRAQSAQETLELRRSQGKLTAVDERASMLSQLTAQQLAGQTDTNIIEDDMLSLQSFLPSDGDKNKSNFDKKKRTVLERLFAVDRDVRKGHLVKHLKKEKRIEALSPVATTHTITPSGDGPRALVIEGAALKHLQGDDELEELIFNVASQCDSVIACRVTPRQKAQLVKLVRRYVEPEPVTLAIGDGANDVGMINAAHVGIGISGKEGQQAVNASDFSIGQFRFLLNLILYHGRWDFLRTTMVVLYTFYKNAVIGFLLVIYNTETLYSGTSIFDQWVMSVYSFVCFFPIFSIGMFDRNLEKAYIRKNPEVYKPTQCNEMITPRTLCRWSLITIVHTVILYWGQMDQLTYGGANTSAFKGLMWNQKRVGDGEVTDWQSVGSTMYTPLVLIMGYKMLYESRSIINGKWPAFAPLFKKTKEGVLSRLPYTWISVIYGSFGVYALFLAFYDHIGQLGTVVSTFFVMVGVFQHIYLTSLTNYAIMIFIPIGAMAIDIAGKVFSNMFYPSQNQIHIELEVEETRQRKKAQKQGLSERPGESFELES